MRSNEEAENSPQSDDLEDIETVKNLLELQSRLKTKTQSLENERD